MGTQEREIKKIMGENMEKLKESMIRAMEKKENKHRKVVKEMSQTIKELRQGKNELEKQYGGMDMFDINDVSSIMQTDDSTFDTSAPKGKHKHSRALSIGGTDWKKRFNLLREEKNRLEDLLDETRKKS